MHLPTVTQSWTCPYFDVIFGLATATIGTGLLSGRSLGAIAAVIVALILGGQLGARRRERRLMGKSC